MPVLVRNAPDVLGTRKATSRQDGEKRVIGRCLNPAPTPKFLNRELSWLEFNQRVLDEATDESLPLLERLKFLAITSSNLDEFFMVRVGGLQMLRERRGTKRDPAGMTPTQQLKAVSQRAIKWWRTNTGACWTSWNRGWRGRESNASRPSS